MLIYRHAFYAMKRLRKLHKQFAHPNADKLYNLLKIAGLEGVNLQTLKILEDVTDQMRLMSENQSSTTSYSYYHGLRELMF